MHIAWLIDWVMVSVMYVPTLYHMGVMIRLKEKCHNNVRIMWFDNSYNRNMYYYKGLKLLSVYMYIFHEISLMRKTTQRILQDILE